VFLQEISVQTKPPSPSNTLPRLGELELTLLKALWETQDQSAHALRHGLPASHACSLSTVQTTLERLHRKALVLREKQGHAYVYRARLGRSELLGKLLGGVIRQLHTGNLAPILSSFVDFADRFDDDTLDQLDELVQRRLERRGDK
jgi:predicted transcriptional regulator